MKALTFWQGEWVEGNPGIMGPRDHAAWLSSIVFDGARAFEGTAPDLDRHCARIVASARTMGLAPLHSPAELTEIARDGIARFAPGAALYVRPMYWGTAGFIVPEPEATAFCFHIHELAMPEPKGSSITVSPFRRPTLETAPADAKASCLYPNGARALREAAARGFDNALMLDALGNVAELTTSNIWMAKDGAALTPVPNGTFLNGITRQRVIALLRAAGVEVFERTLTVADFRDADEIFATGNYGKVLPITRFEDRDLQPGPIYARARELYWEFAHTKGVL